MGALTKVYGTSKNDSGIYATVASVFLFMGAYSFGWTPLLYLYPPEVLNYPIRAVGVGLFQLVANATAVLIVFTINSLGQHKLHHLLHQRRLGYPCDHLHSRLLGRDQGQDARRA